MRKHIKRIAIPRTWPVPRKGTKYLTRPQTGKNKNAIPLLIALRDMLKIAHTKREVTIIMHEKNILVDNKIIKDTSFPLYFYDVLSIPRLNKNYRIEFSKKGKFVMNEINDKDAEKKLCKIIGKKVLRGGKMQVNLHDGKNFDYSQKTKVNDTVVVDLKQNKIVKHIPFKEDATVLIIGGKHAGEKGKISAIKRNIIEIKIPRGAISTTTKNIFVVE